MAERQKGMGRGLAAILSVAPKDDSEELRQLPVEIISPNPSQPRRSFDEESLIALAESIQRARRPPARPRPAASPAAATSSLPASGGGARPASPSSTRFPPSSAATTTPIRSRWR